MGRFGEVIITIDPRDSEKIQESGKDSGGESSFVTQGNTVMIGRRHEGDENGYTEYRYASLLAGPLVVYYDEQNVLTSPPIQESGKDSGGTSTFLCPDNTVVVGRKHSGDENGDTWYRYAELFLDGTRLVTADHVWSSWRQESGKDSGGTSTFRCPPSTIITGRQHEGDENGDTRYRYSSLYLPQEDADDIRLLTVDTSASSSVAESAGVWMAAPTNKVMTGRQHSGDENGQTSYWFSYFRLAPDVDRFDVTDRTWSDWMQESGKKTGGSSEFVCPDGYVLTGREHKGDENGDTRYQYASIRYNGIACAVGPPTWSDEVKESSGVWMVGPPGAVMTGRWHEGDENGDTRNQYSSMSMVEHHAHQTVSCEVTNERVLYPVGWKPYLADWFRYVVNQYPVFRYHDPSELDGVGVLIGLHAGILYGDNLKAQRCEPVRLYPKDQGHYSWVLTPGNGILYVWNSKLDLDMRNYTRHSDLNRGEPVVCAGEFYLTKDSTGISLDQLFVELNDSSGHYKPDGKQCFKYVLDTFEDLGIDRSNVDVYTRDH